MNLNEPGENSHLHHLPMLMLMQMQLSSVQLLFTKTKKASGMDKFFVRFNEIIIQIVECHCWNSMQLPKLRFSMLQTMMMMMMMMKSLKLEVEAADFYLL